MKIGHLKSHDPDMVYDANSFTDPVYVFEESLDSAKYDDITSLANFERLGKMHFDVKRVMTYMKAHVAGAGFENLSEAEKTVACRYFLVENATVAQYLSETEMAEAWKTLNTETKAARQKRWDAVFDYVSLNLPKAYGFDLAFTADAMGLTGNYLTYGLESNEIDGVDGLWDYIEGTSGFAGSPGTGFPSKPYWTQALQDGIMAILRDGAY